MNDQITFRIPNPYRTYLEEKAVKEDCSVSEYMRKLVILDMDKK